MSIQPQVLTENYEAQIETLISQMTLAEKIGQMTQVEKNSITPQEVTTHFIGSVLSGGGGYPVPNTPQDWVQLVRGFQEAALQTRLRIPLVYGADCVHGHNNVVGAVIYPHNIGMGAGRDEQLAYQIGRMTAQDMLATGIHWNFAPAVSTPHDIRWGRTYEGYSERTEIVIPMSQAFIRGLMAERVLPSVKHFVADGGTTWGTTIAIPADQGNNWQAITDSYSIDQGDAQIDEATLRNIHLAPYIEAIAAGVLNIMVSHSSWNGLKMHAHYYLLTTVLKEECGFQGFLVSDWMSINQLDPDYYTCVVKTINAGLDMIMVPFDYKLFIESLTRAVANGDVPESRIDDAVRRILRAKFWLGLFDQPFAHDHLMPNLGSAEHRALAREVVRKTLVLLKNDQQVLPLAKNMERLLVAGRGASDVGMQCGGWSIEWQGKLGSITPRTTILEGIQQTVAANTVVEYRPEGDFTEKAPLGIVVVGEHPYAEGVGDKADIRLSQEDVVLLKQMRQHCEKLVAILISGRPMVLTEAVDLAEAWVAVWWPGTEGNGITDVVFGDYPFVGKSAYTWPRSIEHLTLEELQHHPEWVLFPFGHGLE